MRKLMVVIVAMTCLTGLVFAGGSSEQGRAGGPAAARPVTLRYAHMNAPDSIAGRQATYFAERVKELTGGSVIVEVYPSSQLGTIQEMAEMVSVGTVALHHNTMAGIGALYPDYAVLDTPFLYKDPDHLMRVAHVDSPVMQMLNEKLIETRDVRNLYNFYFGTRQLTANFPVRTPADLRGKRIRAIPFPIYMVAVEGMGALATPIDWAEVPTALATGAADGQENPVDTIYAHKIFDVQSHLMLTSHIQGAEAVVVNESVWQGLSDEQRRQITEAGRQTAEWASRETVESEAAYLQRLKDAGMIVIGPAEGLDVQQFRTRVEQLVRERFGSQYRELYEMIGRIQ